MCMEDQPHPLGALMLLQSIAKDLYKMLGSAKDINCEYIQKQVDAINFVDRVLLQH